jgi:hypothetical protein
VGSDMSPALDADEESDRNFGVVSGSPSKPPV